MGKRKGLHRMVLVAILLGMTVALAAYLLSFDKFSEFSKELREKITPAKETAPEIPE
jgi:hypothetical protein